MKLKKKKKKEKKKKKKKSNEMVNNELKKEIDEIKTREEKIK